MDPRWKHVTIQQLLDHRGGWRLVEGWDPMFATAQIQIAAALNRPSPASARDIVDYMAGQPLQFEPGTERAYSNFGYCLLGRVIERVTGRPYLEYLRGKVLEPLGIRGVEAARSQPKDRPAREPEYVHPFSTRDVFDADSKRQVVEPDGGFAIEPLDSIGGLIASAADVARFYSHYGPGGRSVPPRERPSTNYGELPGTFTMALRLPEDIVIVVLCNQNVTVSGASLEALAGLMERAARKVRSWPSKAVEPP
jgi:CubicO group peptidase (beta-lactamase class C family)